MAHTCPECGSLCHCCGDIDDIDFGERGICKHYLSENCDYNHQDDDDIYDPDDYEPPEPDMNAPDYKEEIAFKQSEAQKLK